MERKPIENLKAVKKYDPTKNYTWEPDDVFTVSGAEIDIWNKAMSVYVNTPEFQRFLVLQRAAVSMQTFIEESVEQGLMKEKVVETTKSPEITEDGPTQ